MVVCRFFLEGRCKYGDRCFNEHPRGNSPAGGGGARGVTFRDSFGTANQQNQSPYRWSASSSTGQPQQAPPQQGGGLSVHDIVKNLPKEMEIWQNSKMWPFSCFSLEKEIPSLPEFVDMSPEELRLDAYTAMQQGTVDIYKQKVSQLVQEYRQKQDQIKSMPQALRQKLIEMLEEGRCQKGAKGINQSLVRPSTFGGQTGGSIFGAGAGSSSVFGSSPAVSSPSSASIFGSTANSGSTFGMGGGTTQHSSSIFGQTSAASSSLFGGSQAAGGATSASLFGQPQPAAGLFGKSATAAPARSAGGSIFGQSAGIGGIFAQSSSGNSTNTAPVGLFGKSPAPGSGFGQTAGAGSIFGQTSGTGSIFGQAPASSAASVFGQATSAGASSTSSIFGQATSAGASSASSVFGQATSASAAPAPGLFGSGGSQSTVFGGSAAKGLFGAAGAQATGGPGFSSGATQPQAPTDSSLYTPLADLTDEEKAQFQARTFTPGMIPMRPPPKEMINM